jgi:hypothetical protein
MSRRKTRMALENVPSSVEKLNIEELKLKFSFSDQSR